MKAFRRRWGLTQTDLARELDRSQPVISRYERDGAPPYVQAELKQLAAKLAKRKKRKK